jgi:hypothetical protein
VPFENEAGLMDTERRADVLGWMVNAVVGVSVSQPKPQLLVRTDGVNVTALPVLLVTVTWAVWDGPAAVVLNVSEGGLAVTPDSVPMTIVTDTVTGEPPVGETVMSPV